VLEHVAARCPVVMHGVSLSIGSSDPINFAVKSRRSGSAWTSMR
jgi:uncharacterized protein (UPF0276 family)